MNEDLARHADTNGPAKPFKTLGASAFIPTEQFKDAGLATPEAAVQTFSWAIREEDKDRFKDVLDTDGFYAAMHEARQRFDPDFKPEEEKSHEDNFNLSDFKRTGELKGMQILSQQFSSADDAELEVAATGADGSVDTNRFTFHRVGTDWKLDVLAMANPESFQFTQTTEGPDGTSRTELVKLKIEQRMTRKLVPELPVKTP